MLSQYSKEIHHGDPLEEVPIDKWTEIQHAFKQDWPRGEPGVAVLRAQRELIEKGFGYGFKVFCPFGKASSGMVAFNKKQERNEIIILCPSDHTTDLEDALKRTRLIDWSKTIVVPFAPNNVIECIKGLLLMKNVVIDVVYPSESFVLQNKRTLFEVSLPPDLTFGLLSLEHAKLVNSCWPHKYPDSVEYFQLLINAKTGFGIFRDQQLISWVFINEAGVLGHLYTVEEERRKGLADLILKKVCNILLREANNVLAYCVEGNVSARNLYEKAGFLQYECGVAWFYLKPKE